MRHATVICVGKTPLLMDRWSGEILPREKRSVKAVTAEKIYRDRQGNIALPTEMLVASIVGAVTNCTKLQYTRSRILDVLRFEGEFVALTNGRDQRDPVWVCDVFCKTQSGSRLPTSICIPRPRFDRWGFTTRICYDEKKTNREVLLRLFQDAGCYSGLGLFSPLRRGQHGIFQVREWHEVSV
ncbi:MAG TPA: hypothetical protein VJI96_00065 [Candidatus Andersenbacteria bacterium]|nr:hypothetical protein [Candidatus Andersenbacteria bacterium]